MPLSLFIQADSSFAAMKLWRIIKGIMITGMCIIAVPISFVLLIGVKRIYEYQWGFDQQVWFKTGKMLHTINGVAINTNNPRENMVSDLMAHHLKPGMTRRQVLALLGPAERDGIEMVLPPGTTIPDSLSVEHYKALNNWYDRHAQPDTIMHYQVGWSMIDPTSMRIQFDGDGKVKRYWVGIH